MRLQLAFHYPPALREAGRRIGYTCAARSHGFARWIRPGYSAAR